MEQHEIDRLMNDIQEYLGRAETKGEGEEPNETAYTERQNLESGCFISAGDKKKIQRFLKFSQIAAYAVEFLTMALFTIGVLIPFQSRMGTLMFLLSVLLFGVFAVTVLHGLRTRVRLLIRIESNTRRIALTKERIAEALGQIQME